MSKAVSRCALVVGGLLGVASASESSSWQPGSAGALDHHVTLSNVKDFRAHKTGDEYHTTDAVGSPAFNAPLREGAAVANTEGTAASAQGVGVKKLALASQRGALSALVKRVRAAAAEAKAEPQSTLEMVGVDQSPLKLVGADNSPANDVINAFSNGGGRKLQESCPETEGLDVTSTLYPQIDSCMEAFEEYGTIHYVSSTGFLSPLQQDADDFWLAGYVDIAAGSDELVPTCYSWESTVVHPTEVSWLCGGWDGDYIEELATGADFVVNCFCDGVVSPTPTPTTSSTDMDDDSLAAENSFDDTTDDPEDESPGIIGSTDGGVGRTLSAWSAAAGAGATGVIAAVMTLALGW